MIAGVDYSMTCPAVTVYSGGAFSFQNCKSYYRTGLDRYVGNYSNISGSAIQEYSSEIDRYVNHAKWVVSLVQGCSLVAIEGYSMGSRGKVFHIAENTAILKYFLEQNKIPYVSVPPTRVKKHACKGNASKEEMYDAFVNLTKTDLRKVMGFTAKKIASPITDVVDSYYICSYIFHNGA